ncbi:MAG: sulfotransferase [Gammaproteobacteria bacterium]|nr:sulfotransferase [Gammaproteobacteria bacterium]
MPDNQELGSLVQAVLERQLFFIAGQGKSGTTWLELILDAHPDVCCHGEGHFADKLLPEIGEATHRYNAFLKTNNALFEEIRDYQGLSRDHVWHIGRTAMALLLAQQCESDLPAAIGERTPANVANLQLLHQFFPEAKLIHITRDPRDVAVSMWFHGLRINPDKAKKEYVSPDQLALKLAGIWVQLIDATRQFAASCPEQYLEVKYESLQQDFAAALRPLLTALGVDASDGTIEKCRDQGSFKKLSGGRDQGDENRQSHFRKGVVGDWKNHLEPATVERIDEIAGDRLAEQLSPTEE